MSDIELPVLRTGSDAPVKYRLTRFYAAGGSQYVLQGYFVWVEIIGGKRIRQDGEWRNIETVEVP